ncbi:hypothetical protein GCM10028772_08720 [Nocardioides ultimimeridianus]
MWFGDRQPLQRRDAGSVREYYASGIHAVCAKGHRLPEGILTNPTVVIALLGQQASGKSLYAATLIDALVTDAVLGDGYTFQLHPTNGERFDAQYSDFLSRGAVPMETQRNIDGEASREPWYLVMHRPDGSQVNILIFDADGRQLTNLETISQYNPHVLATNAFLFLVPPNVFPGVRLMGQRLDHTLQSLTMANVLASNVVTALRAVDPTGEGRVGSLVITKADDIDPAQLGDDLDDILVDLDYHNNGLAAIEGEIIERSQQIQEFLHGHRGAGLTGTLEGYFQHTSYHMTATVRGSSTDGYFSGPPAPVRILGPFVSALINLGVMVPGGAESTW